ncbi:MAG: ABC transporter ATP-binding protein, partial [Erysipelotrichia bacterium]|nr:ABC transporter ATP-binding protein [Erysipelotrichia bacterium]
SAALLYFTLTAAAGLLEAGQNVMITKLGQIITHGLRSELDQKLERLPASYLTAHPAGEIASRFVNDVDTVDSLFTNGIVSMFADACKVISILIVIFTRSLGLGILMIIVTPLLFLMTRTFQKRMLKAQMENRTAIARVSNHIPETIRNIRMIRSFHVQKHMEDRYDDYIDESYHATDRSNLYDSIYSPIVILISASVIAVMMIFAAAGGEFQQLFGMSVGSAVAISKDQSIPVLEGVQLICGDPLTILSQYNEEFDLVVVNPPFDTPVRSFELPSEDRNTVRIEDEERNLVMLRSALLLSPDGALFAIVHPDYLAFINGEKQEIWSQVTGGEHHEAKKSQGYIKWYYDAIVLSDAILVLNFDKKGIKNYIGGNTLMEMAFAHVNNKKVFLLNAVPEDVS